MAEQVKKSWYKKWWVWVIAILVLAGIGTAISQGNKSLSHDYSTIDPVGIMENNLKDMQRYEIKEFAKDFTYNENTHVFENRAVPYFGKDAICQIYTNNGTMNQFSYSIVSEDEDKNEIENLLVKECTQIFGDPVSNNSDKVNSYEWRFDNSIDGINACQVLSTTDRDGKYSVSFYAYFEN